MNTEGKPNGEKLTAMVVKTTTPMIPRCVMTSPNSTRCLVRDHKQQKALYCTFKELADTKIRVECFTKRGKIVMLNNIRYKIYYIYSLVKIKTFLEGGHTLGQCQGCVLSLSK